MCDTGLFAQPNNNCATSKCSAVGDKDACCKPPLKCSTKFVDFGADTAGGKTACPANSKLVKGLADCSTLTCEESETSCCAAPATCASGFAVHGTETILRKCPQDHQVSTGNCAGLTCADTDTMTCCQRKCTAGAFKDGVTIPEASKATSFNCPAKTRIAPLAYCQGGSCKASTDSGCCQLECAAGGLTCGTNMGVSSTGYCQGPTCADADKDTCCTTKCSTGFELFGGKTAGKTKCAKDLQVHATAYCSAKSCTDSSSVCCQQKCTAGFKKKGADDKDKTECPADHTVSAKGYCSGSSCASADSNTCCLQMCTKGYKVDGATTKEPNTCPKGSDTPTSVVVSTTASCAGTCKSTDSAVCCNTKCADTKLGFKPKGNTASTTKNECDDGQVVSTKNVCEGTCDKDDKATCCLSSSSNNTSATTDANSAGLAAVVGILIVLSVVS